MDVDKLIKRKQRAKQDGNLQQMVEIVKDLGDLYFDTGRMEDALQEYLEQLEVCNALADKLNIAIAHRMIGEVYTALGDYEQAFIHQNLYLEGAAETNNLLEEQRAYATLGRTHFCHAESLAEKSREKREALSNAKKAYTKSIHLCKELEDTAIERKELLTMRARLLLNLGLVLEAQEEHGQAVDLIEKAAIVCEDENLREDFHRTQIALASIYERQADFTKSLTYLENASAIESVSLKAEARLAKAELLLKMEKWQESRKILVSLYVNRGLSASLKSRAEKFLRIVATLQETERLLGTETTADGKSKLYEKLGDAAVAGCCFDKALDYYRSMLAWAEESSNDAQIGAALISLAQTLKDAGRLLEALPYAERELGLHTEPREICRSALFLADLLIESGAAEVDRIYQTYDLALNNASKTDRSMQSTVFREFSSYLEKIGHLEKLAELRETANAIIGNGCSDKSSSGEETDEDLVGADICLEELTDIEELKSLGAKRADRRRPRRTIVKRNEKGETQLHVACINGNIEAVEKLLAVGHPVNLRDHAGWSPLHEAANHGYTEIARLLLEHGANVNDPGGSMCSGVTPLHDAATCGHLSMMQLLMEHGANVVLTTANGETVLDCLRQWRNRVDLTAEEQVEYDDVVRKLSAVIPENSTLEKNKQRMKPLETESSSSSSSSSETDDDGIEKISAGEDYKRTIASLKHRESRIGVVPARKKPELAPLLNSEQVLEDDDWLEVDIARGRSREKRRSGEGFTEKRKSIDSIEELRRLGDSMKNGAKRQKMSESIELDDVETSESLPSLSKTTVTNESKLKRRQVSLLSIGFTRDSSSRTPSPVFPGETVETPKIEKLSLNVHVDGTIFRVDVQFPKEGPELIEKILSDVKESFYNESGCRSRVDLQTLDGGLLLPENVSILLKNGVKDLRCKILELSVPPILERYGTLCNTYNIEVRESVSKCLKSCENTSILRKKLEEITRPELTCMLKVIQFQRNIQVLHLTSGEMDKYGQLLNRCLVKLSSLQELCLASCDISFNCLNELEEFPVGLKVLDLSFNPLGRKSHEKLGKLLIPLKQLKTLNLRCCMLENFRDRLTYENLIDLDISWNEMSLDGISSFLQRQLLNLNLSHAVRSNVTNLIPTIVNSGFSLASMESIELASCNLSDLDVETILSAAPNLSRLVLSGNERLTDLSAKRLLAYRPTLRNIDMIGCSIIASYPDSEILIETPQICTFLATMEKQVCPCWLTLWRGNGTIEMFSNNIVTFKPIGGIRA